MGLRVVMCIIRLFSQPAVRPTRSVIGCSITAPLEIFLSLEPASTLASLHHTFMEMADPLSATGSVVDILSLAFQISQGLA